MRDLIIHKLNEALRAIREREGQWMYDHNKRYVELTVAEMRFILEELKLNDAEEA